MKFRKSPGTAGVIPFRELAMREMASGRLRPGMMCNARLHGFIEQVL
jgi:hypothetical protein